MIKGINVLHLYNCATQVTFVNGNIQKRVCARWLLIVFGWWSSSINCMCAAQFTLYQCCVCVYLLGSTDIKTLICSAVSLLLGVDTARKAECSEVMLWMSCISKITKWIMFYRPNSSMLKCTNCHICHSHWTIWSLILWFVCGYALGAVADFFFLKFIVIIIILWEIIVKISHSLYANCATLAAQ